MSNNKTLQDELYNDLYKVILSYTNKSSFSNVHISGFPTLCHIVAWHQEKRIDLLQTIDSITSTMSKDILSNNDDKLLTLMRSLNMTNTESVLVNTYLLHHPEFNVTKETLIDLLEKLRCEEK